MTEGRTPLPTAAPAEGRHDALRRARDGHIKAVVALEAAQDAYCAAVNALPLPELMQGPVVRVTDLDSIGRVRTVLDLAGTALTEIERLVTELEDYRTQRADLAEEHNLAALGELVANTAAAVAREGKGA